MTPLWQWCLAASLAFSWTLPAAETQGTDSLRDQQLQERIQKDLKKQGIKNLEITVRDQTVTLRGKVRSVWAKEKALEIAFSSEQVKEVDSELEVVSGESDTVVGREIAKEIRKYTRFTVFDDVNLAVDDGRVTLGGWVTEPYKSTEIAKRASKVLGVKELDNQIRVLPVSQSDRRLRRTLANRIYRDSLFSDYASQPIPPIHIIVANSRVLLTGVVRSQLEKQKAASIVRQTAGVLSVENRLRVGK